MKEPQIAEAYQKGFEAGKQERETEILRIIRDYICSFQPTINFRDWLIKEIKEKK